MKMPDKAERVQNNLNLAGSFAAFAFYKFMRCIVTHTLCCRRSVPAVLLMVFSICFITSNAQFYNGSQLTFGKTRVQYRDLFWTYFRFDKFDTYFYLNGKELAIYASEYADKHIKEIEMELQSNVEEKIQFIIFDNLSDLKQSNIGLVGNWDSYNTGGVTRIIGGKVLIYFDGNYDHFEQQIRAGITQVILNEMIYGTGVGSQIKNNALFTMPEWYINGLIAYISKKWNTETDNIVRDAILSNKYRKFNRLTGLEAANAGHSLWNFIALKYGESNIPNIVYMARLNRNVEKGFLYVLGISFDDLINEWLNFYRNMYASEETTRNLPAGEMIHVRPKAGKVLSQLKINPEGNIAAFCTHELGVYKVFLYNLGTGKKKKIFRGGYRIAEKPDETYPILAWHPSGKILAMVIERKGYVDLYFYSMAEKHFEKQVLDKFQKVLDFSYSDDGNLLLFSAVQGGQSDIFVFNITSSTYEQITKDIYNDLNPRFINHSRAIIFSSNRDNDTIRFDPETMISKLHFNNDLFLYDYAGKRKILYRITNTPAANETQPMVYDEHYFTYLSDDNGIRNRYLARFDSTITYIDTTTHYRYFTYAYPVTNYSRNILEQDVSPQGARVGEIVFHDQHYTMYTYDRILPERTGKIAPQNTMYQEMKKKQMMPELPENKTEPSKKIQTPQAPKKKHFSTVTLGDVLLNVPASDSLNFPKQGNARIFIPSSARDTSLRNMILRQLQQAHKDSIDKYKKAKALNYNVEYSLDKIVTQIDFNYLNSTYQPFTGAKVPIFINPGLNALLLIGITDLMEDYRITGGVRLNFNLVNNEYLLSYSNLSHRLDHQLIYHRQTIEEQTDYSYIRHRINEGYYIATYPFTPILNIKGTAGIRYDHAIFLSTDQINLQQPDINNYWGNLKAELTYDNTQDIGLNLYLGTRYKVFGEYYNLLNNTNNNMFVLGLDYRHYERIHRTMILALRFAASTSFGERKLIYYMGGVDNWLFPSFNQNTPIALDQNYAFQTLATNLRGFTQNIRNGNSFFVVNAEVRLPVFRYFYDRPIRSDFLNNFQVVAFGDVGTAWTGISPYSEQNQLFIQYISNNPLFIKVQLVKDPLVEGFGGGLRSRILGYFLRGDLAWGVEDGRIRKPIFYLSLSLDF